MGGDTLRPAGSLCRELRRRCAFHRRHVGSTPKPSSVDDLLKRRPELAARLAEKGMDRAALGRLTYTGGEAWLAIEAWIKIATRKTSSSSLRGLV